MNALKATLMVAAFGLLAALVDAAMTGPILYLTIMAAGIAAIGVVAARPSWKP